MMQRLTRLRNPLLATFSITPNTVAKGDSITISWGGFEPTYSIILESVSGPGTISSIVGPGPSGGITEIVVMDPGVWVLRLRQPTPEGDIISNEVTLTITDGVQPDGIPWLAVVATIIAVGAVYLVTK